MPADIALYSGREQSYIKHQFLTRYLQTAAFKVLQAYSTFNFVDAFAGPWKVRDEAKYSDASFDQAIDTLEAVRAELAKGGRRLKLRFCFCELDPEATNRLRTYAQSKGNYEIHVFQGRFEDNLDAVASKIPDGFTFTFIDPTGWDIRTEDIFQFLRRQKGEFLLNFMADHINRHSEHPPVEGSFGRFLADPRWKARWASLPCNIGNEYRILHLLKERIREEGLATYLPDFSIMLPREDRLKMRLVLGTKNERGLEVFREVERIVELEEIKLRDELRRTDPMQVRLFSDDDLAAMVQGIKGVGCTKYRTLAEERVTEFLQSRPSAVFRAAALHAMSEVPIRMTDARDIVVDMKRRGVLTFDLEPGKRKPQDNTILKLSQVSVDT
ncbi:three-Cys-motif partner protein [Amaricoccus macauensis]|uniref:Three-Cys-motif partner protein n=1 Tax=Amaricoccus macauensis TaxID=57001 RepID=A0A840SEX8_9RHOB|nr:three-Cys-motif partner protein TcmP [Amaricoccus macauensis]MBB5220377.1 three-Cys-motif partner protein [Amaricoccus macauensis]